jgi:hypothetical protein
MLAPLFCTACQHDPAKPLSGLIQFLVHCMAETMQMLRFNWRTQRLACCHLSVTGHRELRIPQLPGHTVAQMRGLVADCRSDTVTRPSPGMLAAMMGAVVGDDVWGDDPTVNELQVRHRVTPDYLPLISEKDRRKPSASVKCLYSTLRQTVRGVVRACSVSCSSPALRPCGAPESDLASTTGEGTSNSRPRARAMGPKNV